MDPVAAQKLALRDRLLTTRRRRSLVELRAAAEAIAARALATPEVRRSATVAAYVSVGAEPGTGPLLEALLAAGRRLLLPVVLPGLDLDWAAWAGDRADLAGSRGLLEPAGRRLGVDAVATADLVLVPALAVDRAGHRLGRGGGCYDRALGRVPVGTPVWALLHEGELLEAVPVAPHDRPVTGAITPSGPVRLPTAGA